MEQLAESKLILLYLIEKMGIPLSNSDICQFLLERNYMDYFTVQQYLSELVEVHLLEKNKQKNHTRYLLTKKGKEIINYFITHISEEVQQEINAYVQQNKKRIHTESEVSAHYFLEPNNDYIVKCILHDGDNANLMEISMVVATQEQAEMICNNWKNNVSRLYGAILNVLVNSNKQKHS